MEQSPAPRRRGRIYPLLGLAVGLIAVVAAVVAIGFHNVVARAVLRSVGHGFGYDIAAQTLNVNLREARAGDVRITTTAGEPVFEARRVDVGFSLRDLLPGGKRLFGLTSVTVERPHITVIHHRDGSYNITLPQSSAPPAKPSTAALDVELHVSGGTVDLIDRFVAPPRERRLQVVGIGVQGAISPSTRWHRAKMAR